MASSHVFGHPRGLQMIANGKLSKTNRGEKTRSYLALRSAGIFVETDASLRIDRPKAKKSEKFGDWCRRVFAVSSKRVLVFLPIQVDSGTSMASLAKKASHLRATFRAYRKLRDQTSAASAEIHVQTVARDTLRDLLAGDGPGLPSATREYVQRLLDDPKGTLDVQSLLQQVISDFGKSVRRREKS